MANKEIDKDKFYILRLDGEEIKKIYTTYKDGSLIKLTPEQQKEAEQANKQATSRALKQHENSPEEREKPEYKRKGFKTKKAYEDSLKKEEIKK